MMLAVHASLLAVAFQPRLVLSTELYNSTNEMSFIMNIAPDRLGLEIGLI